MKKVVAYICTGSEKSDYEEQRMQILLYCRDHDMHIIKWYEDKDIRGVGVDRPELEKMLYLEDKNPQYEAIVVANNGCISKEIKEYYFIKMQIMKKNLELIAVDDNLGEYDSMRSFLDSLTLYIAKKDRVILDKRASAARKKKAEAGGFAGGRVPYGYKIVNGTLQVIEKEAECVRMVFKLRKKGLTLREIAEEVNKAGYRTQKGNLFAVTNIQNVLKNEQIYRGHVKYGEVVKGKHERIL